MRSRSMAGLTASFLLGLVLLTGCYPIELDTRAGKVLIPREEGIFEVDPVAKTAKRLYAAPAGESPVFALYAPDGKSIIAVTQTSGGMMGNSCVYRHVPLGGGEPRKVFSGANGAYCQISPDGGWLTVAQVSQQAKPPIDQNMPEIHLIKIADGSKRIVASNTGTRHVWLPDSSAVLVFQALVKGEEGGYTGTLSSLPVAEKGEGKALVTMMGESLFYDLSPDGKKVLLVANAAVVGETKLEPAENTALYELTLAGTKLRKVQDNVKFAFYGPTGEDVLVGRETGGDMGDSSFVLEVADAQFKGSKPVAADASAQAGGMGASSDIFPAWLNNDTIVYLAEKAVYGTAGTNLMLTTVKADGTGVSVLQATIDSVAATAAD